MSSILPKLKNLPATFPLEGAVTLEIQEGVPIFRATKTVQDRIEILLEKQQEFVLSEAEEKELDSYVEIDDYLSFVNRTIRNLLIDSESGVI